MRFSLSRRVEFVWPETAEFVGDSICGLDLTGMDMNTVLAVLGVIVAAVIVIALSIWLGKSRKRDLDRAMGKVAPDNKKTRDAKAAADARWPPKPRKLRLRLRRAGQVSRIGQSRACASRAGRTRTGSCAQARVPTCLQAHSRQT